MISMERASAWLRCVQNMQRRLLATPILHREVRSAKDSPYNLLLSQFRRAIGCLAIRNAIEEKLCSVHLIRPSKADANNAAQAGIAAPLTVSPLAGIITSVTNHSSVLFCGTELNMIIPH